MTALLQCSDVSCGWDQPVLSGIDLTVQRGEIVLIIGTSGSGKSTLLRTCIGLAPPLAGEVRLLGKSLYQVSADERERLLRRTGTAFQQDALFGSMSVGDNVALPLRELSSVPEPVVREMVRMRLGLVGLGGMEPRAATSLSGGERKRAALARATILDPELVFCDEPSAGLDPVIAAGLDEMLLRLRDALGCSLVVVSHELASIHAIADRVVMLSGGSIYAQGTLAELSSSHDPEIYNFFHRVAPPQEPARGDGRGDAA